MADENLKQEIVELSSSGAINPCTCITFLNENLLCLSFGPWIHVTSINKIFSAGETAETIPFCLSNTHDLRKAPYRFLGFGSSKNNRVIHGMTKSKSNLNEDLFLIGVYGGRQLVFHEISVSSSYYISYFMRSKVFILSDWIHDLRLLDGLDIANERESIVAVVCLAHNYIETWNFPLLIKNQANRNQVLFPTRLNRVICNLRCISYSMAFSEPSSILLVGMLRHLDLILKFITD